MSKEVIEESGFLEIQQLYKSKLEERRKNIKWDDEIRHVFGTQSSWHDSIDAITVLDYWFLKHCDGNQKVKKYLGFYYDCIKNGRYDKISEKIIKNRKNYEHACLDFFRNDELLKGRGGPSDLHLELEKVTYIPTCDSKEKEDRFEAWKEFQDSIAQILFKYRFHLNLIIPGVAVSFSHPFLGELWMSHEFGVIGDNEETPGLMQGFNALQSVLGFIPPDTTKALNPDLELKLLSGELFDFGKVNDSTTIRGYMSCLTKLANEIIYVLVKHYTIFIDLILYERVNAQVQKDSPISSELDFLDKLNFFNPKYYDVTSVPKQIFLDPTCANDDSSKENSDFSSTDSDNLTDFSYPTPSTSKNEMVVFINSYDYFWIFALKEKCRKDALSFYHKVKDYESNGSKIHNHPSIPPLNIITFQRGCYALINLLTGFKKKDSGFYLHSEDFYYKFDFFAHPIGVGGCAKPHYSNVLQTCK